MQELVRDVASAQVGKYQHVRPLLQHAERIRRTEDVLVHRRVGLHLAVDDHRGSRFLRIATALATFSASG